MIALAVKNAGEGMYFVVTLLVLGFLWQLPRVGANRAMIRPWLIAFGVLAILQGQAAYMILAGYLHLWQPPPTMPMLAVVNAVVASASMVFMVLVALAAIAAAQRPISRSARRWILGVSAVVALSAGRLLGGYATRLGLLGSFAIIAGAALLVLRAATGDRDRERGLVALAGAMVAYSLISLVIDLWNWGLLAPSLGEVRVMGALEPFVFATVTLLLGVAVGLMVLQDSVLQVAQMRESHLRDVRASEARLNRIIEAAGEAILTFTPARIVELANEAAARLFRLPSGELVGRRLDDLIGLEDGDWDEGLGGVLSGRVTQATVTGTGQRPGDAAFPIEFTVGALVRDGDGAAGGVAILRDLSQRFAIEAERERFERRIAESEKMLAIGRVVSGVAHELNNPLAVVLGQSEQLVEHGSDTELRDGMRLINEQAHRARHIVRDLLAFVRHREDHREPVSLVDLVARVVAAQSAEAVEQGVTVEVEPTSDTPLALADRLALEQVLVNLLDNAMDATGRGGTVRVGVAHRRGVAEIWVDDNGPGVAEGLQARIFEPFFTTKPTGQGTGLGLSVSVGLLEQIGGSLTLENHPAPGIGARFVVRLPLAPDEAPPSTSARPEQPSRVLLPSGEPGLAMVIDDEPAVRTTLGRIFQRWGWSVAEEPDAAVALERLVSGDGPLPDVVLCDLRMPGMTGEAFFAALVSRRPELRRRVVFVTGDVVAPETSQFLAGAGRPVVEKPFTIAEIADLVARVTAAA